MTPIPSVQSLQPGLPHPDVEFLQQKDRSETHGVGQFSDVRAGLADSLQWSNGLA